MRPHASVRLFDFHQAERGRQTSRELGNCKLNDPHALNPAAYVASPRDSSTRDAVICLSTLIPLPSAWRPRQRGSFVFRNADSLLNARQLGFISQLGGILMAEEENKLSWIVDENSEWGCKWFG